MTNRYRLSTDIEPFMKTQKTNNGYITSYAQIRVHHGTHADFPTHVGLSGDPIWDLSGDACIITPDDMPSELESVVFVDTDGTDLPAQIVDYICEVDSVSVIGTDHYQVGDLDVHERLLGEGIAIIENLVNLDAPAKTCGHATIFATLIAGCDDGAPVNVAFDTQES